MNQDDLDKLAGEAGFLITGIGIYVQTPREYVCINDKLTKFAELLTAPLAAENERLREALQKIALFAGDTLIALAKKDE